MLTDAGSLVGAMLRTLGRQIGLGRSGRIARCWRQDVRTEHEIRTAAFQIAPNARMEVTIAQRLLRELVELNTPALYLNVVQRPAPVQVMLHPWSGRTIRFRGNNYFLDAGAEAVEGVEAFTPAPASRMTTLYPTAPDHPVYAISIEHQGGHVCSGYVPPYITHVTLVVNGQIIAQAERLLHERGPRIWAA